MIYGILKLHIDKEYIWIGNPKNAVLVNKPTWINEHAYKHIKKKYFTNLTITRSNIMADITMCTNSDCTIKEKCYRYTAHASKQWQSFSKFKQVNGTCDYYWETKLKDK